LTRESFVLDPRDRMAGRLDPKMPVTGSAKEIPFREALKKLLESIGVKKRVPVSRSAASIIRRTHSAHS
jgi:hypothetical protein